MKFTVKTSLGERTVRATWHKGGLAVHRSILSGYAISHVPSGYAVVCRGLEAQHAVLMAQELLALADWSTLTTEQMLDKDFYHAVWQVIAQGRERGRSGLTPEQHRLALYASDFDPDVMRRL